LPSISAPLVLTAFSWLFSVLVTCVPFPAPDAKYTWREEARFAAPLERALAPMCLLWGLARVLRVSGGNSCPASMIEVGWI
jgi:hypothetical protein